MVAGCFRSVLFVALVLAHEPIRRAGDRARRAVEFYAKGLARLDGRWAGQGVAGLEYLDLDHPMPPTSTSSAGARCSSGSARRGPERARRPGVLAARAGRARRRSRAARGDRRAASPPRPARGPRAAGAEVRAGIDPAALAAWGARRESSGPAHRRSLGADPGDPRHRGSDRLALLRNRLLALLLIVACSKSSSRCRRRPRPSRPGGRRPADARPRPALRNCSRRLEREPFERPSCALARRAARPRVPASSQIRRLARLLQLLDARRNQFFVPFAAIWLWTTQLAIRIDAWRGGRARDRPAGSRRRRVRGTLCPGGLRRGEPGRPVPRARRTGRLFRGRGGRPSADPGRGLRPQRRRAGRRDPVLIVSGSNMSGKSTSADRGHQRGARPGRRAGPCPAAAALAAGRRRHAADPGLAPGRPLAVLRRDHPGPAARGPLARARCRSCSCSTSSSTAPTRTTARRRRGGRPRPDRRGAIGLVTTHDLALAQIADGLAPRAINVHFEDQLVDGQMHFDYRMRPGVVQHSNALALMRAIGLEV